MRALMGLNNFYNSTLSNLYTALLQSLNHVKTALRNGAESFDDKHYYEISNDRHAQSNMQPETLIKG